MKKLFILGIIISLIIIGCWFIFIYNQGGDVDIYQEYENTEYGFKLEYPKSWRFSGLTADSSIISFKDTRGKSGEGGFPLGAKIEIIVLENYDNLALEDWIDQSLAYSQEQEILSEETVRGKNVQFLVKTFKPMPGPVESVGPPISAYALINDKKHIVQINYLGREPNYTAGMKHFKHLLLSFWAENIKIKTTTNK